MSSLSNYMVAVVDNHRVAIEKMEVYRVLGGSLENNPWFVYEVDMVEDDVFIPMKKETSGFRRFVVGSSCGQMRDFKFLDQLRGLRIDGRLRSMGQVGPSLFGNAHQSKYAKRKHAAQAKLMRGSDPETVTVSLPRLEFEGRIFERIEMKLKGVKHPKEVVSVEFTQTNLEYIRAALLTCGSFDAPRKRRKPDVESTQAVKWDAKRNQYIVAMKDEDRCTRYISITPRSADEFDVANARDLGLELSSLTVEEARRRAQESRVAAAEMDIDQDGPAVSDMEDDNAFGAGFDDADSKRNDDESRHGGSRSGAAGASSTAE